MHQFSASKTMKQRRPRIAASRFQAKDSLPEFPQAWVSSLCLRGGVFTVWTPGIYLRMQGIVQGSIELI